MGILIFEMLSGNTPFNDKDTYCIYRNITSGYFELPENIKIEAKNLISRLLEKDITQRLCCSYQYSE